MFYLLLVAAVAMERLAELVVSRRNLAWSMERGGRESGRGHYPVMASLHAGLLAGCLIETFGVGRRYVPALGRPMLALVLASQCLRWWCILTLGHRWNTRIVIVPGLPLIRRGPYRRLRHPNYVAVVVEGAALPLVHSAWVTAVTFTALDAVVLRVRIRAENAALRELVRDA